MILSFKISNYYINIIFTSPQIYIYRNVLMYIEKLKIQSFYKIKALKIPHDYGDIHKMYFSTMIHISRRFGSIFIYSY